MAKYGTYLIVALIIIFGLYLYIATLSSPFEPVGRLGLVKLANPDMAPGHPQSKVVANYAEKRGSKCVIVVHFAGDASYSHYKEGNVTVINMAFIDPKGPRTNIDWGEVIQVFLFGIPADKYNYRVDGYEFDTLDEAMAYVKNLAKKNGQKGPMPLFFHGTVRKGNIFINPGCGFPLYVQLVWKQYGRFGAYYYIARGLIEPYLNNPYAVYEMTHASDLNRLYNQGALDY